MYYFWLGLGFWFVCLYFFFLLPLLLSELTSLKINVACVPAESVLQKESLFIPLLKISLKGPKNVMLFSSISASIPALEMF